MKEHQKTELGYATKLRGEHWGTDFKQIQYEARRWREYNFGDKDSNAAAAAFVQQFLGVVEEVGELSHAMLKEIQGIHASADTSREAKNAVEAKQQDAVADIVIFLINFCTLRGWSFDRLVAEVWAQVRERDWRKYPKNGWRE